MQPNGLLFQLFHPEAVGQESTPLRISEFRTEQAYSASPGDRYPAVTEQV